MFVLDHNGLAFGIQLNRTDPLLFPQRMRHTDLVKHRIIPTVRTGRILIETTHISIQIIRAAGTGNQRQIGRFRTKPFGRVFGIHRRQHDITHFIGGKHQVFLDLILGQADVSQAVKTHTAGRVAGKTVVGEDLRTVLQADLVTQVDIDFFIIGMAS